MDKSESTLRPITFDLFLKLKEKQDKNEHELTRQFISEKIDSLTEELSKKEDLLKVKDEIIHSIRDESLQIRQQLDEQIVLLRQNQVRFLPYKRLFKTSLYFLSLFFASFGIEQLFNIRIMEPFWSVVGIIVSIGFMIMSYSMYLDWQNKMVER